MNPRLKQLPQTIADPREIIGSPAVRRTAGMSGVGGTRTAERKVSHRSDSSYDGQ
jgi:hypothetical protein